MLKFLPFDLLQIPPVIRFVTNNCCENLEVLKINGSVEYYGKPFDTVRIGVVSIPRILEAVPVGRNREQHNEKSSPA